MSAYNVVVLRGDLAEWAEEAYANDANVRPGFLLEVLSTGKVQNHSTPGGRTNKWVAKEDYLRGMGVTGALQPTLFQTTPGYGSGDLVLIHRCQPGDRIQMVLPAGESVTNGDWGVSYGNGKVCKGASSYYANAVADSTTITNTTVETAFSTATGTIPKNTLKVGDLIRIRGSVAFPATNSTDTATIKVYLGSTAVLTIPATDVANDDVASFDITLTVRTIGASGTFVGLAKYSIGVLGTATERTQTVNSTAVDTTAALAVTAKVTWSVANAGNQAILRVWSVTVAKGLAGSLAASGEGVFCQFKETSDLSVAVTDGLVEVEIL